MTMTTVSDQPDTHRSTPALLRYPICPDLSTEILCWLRLERELRADLATCNRDDDVEVLTQDLRRAERQVEALIALGRMSA
jgi:hypothetical protein